VHLALAEIVPEVAGDPELGPVQVGGAVVALVDPVGQVGTAEVLRATAHSSVLVPAVRGGLGVEVALAEHRAAAGLDSGHVRGPVRPSAGGWRRGGRGASR